MRAVLFITALLLFLAIPATLANPLAPDIIVPGERIGPVRLGMSESEVRRLNVELEASARCLVEATFRNGRAVELTTAWGGACMTAEGVQVGSGYGAALSSYGSPETFRAETTYRRDDGSVSSTAYWARYMHRGVGFRIVVPEGEANATGLVQTIAIFKAER